MNVMYDAAEQMLLCVVPAVQMTLLLFQVCVCDCACECVRRQKSVCSVALTCDPHVPHES